MMVSVFTPDEAFQSVTLREACYGAFAVLPDPACEVAGHPGVEDAIWLVSQYVNPTTPHAVSLQIVGGRDKPGHYGGGV